MSADVATVIVTLDGAVFVHRLEGWAVTDGDGDGIEWQKEMRPLASDPRTGMPLLEKVLWP